MATKQKQLKNLQQEYGKVKGKEKSSWDIITDLNKLYKVDRILLKEAYDAYPKRDQLEKSNEYNLIEKFYRYTFDNLDEIEKKYLSANDLSENETSTYLINKNSTSKFVRDENDHYKAIFKKHAEKINADQLGINALKMYKFMKELFSTQYTELMLNGAKYFQESKEEEIKAIIKNYYVSIKEANLESFVIDNAWLEEEQVLDFLSFWLKELENQDFFVLYCRTEEKLKKEMEYLISQASSKTRKFHPSVAHLAENFPVEESEGKQEKQQKQEEKEEEKVEEEKEENAEGNKEEVSQIEEKIKKNQSFLEKYRKNKVADESEIIEKPEKKILTKKQQFEQLLSQLFLEGSRKRYPLPSGRTFDQIYEETTTMNMYKFANFCKDFGIQEYMSRELIVEFFKMYALNRRVLDDKRFHNIMMRMAESDERIMDRFLHREKKKKEKEKAVYKFNLRPVNGKDVESLEYQLSRIKLQKSKTKEEKLRLYYAKKNQVPKYIKKKKEKERASSISNYVLPERTSILELENMRDDKFDPETFIEQEKDELWNIYESKLWGKEKEKEKNLEAKTPILENALSKRIEKGSRIVKKMTEKNVKFYG